MVQRASKLPSGELSKVSSVTHAPVESNVIRTINQRENCIVNNFMWMEKK